MGTFYSPYNFNRHLSHFQRKNYQFWHELYRNNYEPQPFLRYSQPGFISSGPLNKMHTLDAVPLIPSTNEDTLNANNHQNQWSGLNDVYGYGFRYPSSGLADENVPTSSIAPPTKRTTRPRTTYTTRERTTVSLSTEANTRPTVEIGASTSTEAVMSSTPKPTKTNSQLLAQIAQINNSSQGILGQLGKPTRKPGSSSGSSRPSASQLLQQIQKVNSSAQSLLVTLKPNTKFLGFEIKDEMVWTTARTTTEQEEIPVVTSKAEDKVEKVQTKVEERETQDFDENVETTTNLMKTDENPTSSESSEKMVLVSTSKTSEEDIESRNTDLDLPGTETTQMSDTDDIESTTDPLQEDLNELDNRHEEYDIEDAESMEEKEGTTVKTDESDTEVKPANKKSTERFDEETTTNFEENEIEILSETTETTFGTTETDKDSDSVETTTTMPLETTTLEPEDESDVDQELIEFILIDIVTTASALQNVLNSILNPIGLSLSPEFSILEALLTRTRESGATTPEAADKIGVQITKITSNIGLKRLRSTKILELTQRLIKLGKLLKLSVSNA